MARSKTSIINDALRELGGRSILDPTEDSRNARVTNAAYNTILEEMLEAHDWTFASKRVTLVKLAETPAFGYSNKFDLPNDYIAVRETYPAYAKFKIESGALLTNASGISMRYTALVTDPNAFTPQFAKLFSLRLAAACCYTISQDQSLSDRLKKEATDKLLAVQSNDSKVSGTPETAADDVWLSSRNDGFGYNENENAAVVPGFDYGTVS